jgi:methylated-DNA-[protein]-cysteine S-methyltransferase
MEQVFVDYCKSPIGPIKVQANVFEVIGVSFVDKQDEAVSKNNITIDTIKQLDEYFEGKRQAFDLPLRFHGTKFQVDCLKAMLVIPYGKTISYKEEAQMVGNEKAVRAVGNANRVNKIGIIIPCHRVIGSDGRLVGYAGRIDLKAWLIEHEKRNLIK